ncbi:MAG: TIGR02206 family membrane protein [Ruminococcaceae bacterium]|nr:TIGR02206 family membrane protein [Oscillospiraceae bacterium]
MFQYFFECSGTIVKGVGFSHFDPLHLAWLFVFVLFCGFSCYFYKKTNTAKRKKIRFIFAGLLVLDEILKIVGLAAFGNYNANYLPFHLCSINILLIVIHAAKPFKVLDNFLYTICIPGALVALLFPTWTKLPLLNFMHLHSFTVHILLAVYPIMLTFAGDIRPRIKDLPKSLFLLVGMAIPIYFVNVLFDTNFMFLMEADKGNPLYIFEKMWGNHLWGFPVIISGVLLVMYFPHIVLLIKNKTQSKNTKKSLNNKTV